MTLLTSMFDFKNDIICTDRNGVANNFKYHLKESKENENKKWVFMIIPENNINIYDWFEFAVTEIDNENGKVTIMSHKNNPEYVAKGIPEKMIEESSIVLNKSIHSSSNIAEFKSFETEWRSDSATKVWRRLQDQNNADYSEASDTYTFVN
ncbi:hypothetical protein [Flavobacterium sp. Leaf82]|uniref:hypothetical protein n=1 Tax=Flavobacterium sp. Leaf82 TaxID=1736238 RepID=UPI000A4877F5|nr:hypothetical protein [Flavobacterium sp. Leaf82]